MRENSFTIIENEGKIKIESEAVHKKEESKITYLISVPYCFLALKLKLQFPSYPIHPRFP
jgi:hypothetical protein